MAMRGPCIGVGYVEGVGSVDIFTDLDNTTSLFVVHKKSGEQRYLPRSRVEFRKGKK